MPFKICKLLISFLQIYNQSMMWFPGKLKEFNGTLNGDHKLDETNISQLEQLMNAKSSTAQQVDTLYKALRWPTGKHKTSEINEQLEKMKH